MKFYCQDYTPENILSFRHKENAMDKDLLSFLNVKNKKLHPNPYP